MVPLPEGQINRNTTFLMLDAGRLIFDGSLHELHAFDKRVRSRIPGVVHLRPCRLLA
jgi:hypothetical protein